MYKHSKIYNGNLSETTISSHQSVTTCGWLLGAWDQTSDIKSGEKLGLD
jgi:hypothetical protein